MLCRLLHFLNILLFFSQIYCFSLQELLDQRLKLQQKESDLEKLTYELERMRLNQETRMGDHEAGDQRYADIHLYIQRSPR